jgi:sec-independent protein translocase protein TatA
MRRRLSDRAARNGIKPWVALAFGTGCCSARLRFSLFGGKGKISDIMGDVAKGVKSFKKGLADDDEPSTATTASSTVTPRPLENRVGVDANDVHKVS